jgi:hypothetical protein
MRVLKGPGEKDSSNDEWEYVCRPHHTQFPEGAVIDEDLQWEDMFHDAFVAPTMDANRNGGPLLDNQVATTSGVANGPCDISTTIQIEEALAHDVHQTCVMLDDVTVEPQIMEEQGYGPHGGNVKCQFENMECDQTRQAGIDSTSNMHGKQDGMGNDPCKGGDTKIPSVLHLKPTIHYT